LKFVFISPGEDRLGHEREVGANAYTALFDDRSDGTDEVLIGAHASGDAVHDDANALFCHVVILLLQPQQLVDTPGVIAKFLICFDIQFAWHSQIDLEVVSHSCRACREHDHAGAQKDCFLD